MTVKLKGSNIEVPEPEQLPTGGGYTGFNSLNLQEYYSCSRFPAHRSQIAHGWGKPVIQRLPNGDLVASQYKFLAGHPNPRYPAVSEEAALCYSYDGGATWTEPRLLGIPGRISQLSVLSDGAMILTTQPFEQSGGMYRSTDGSRTFGECSVPWEEIAEDKRPSVLRGFGETNGALELPDGRLLLLYGNRQFPFGIQVIASYDLGKTWDLEHFLMLAWASWDNYGGHPRSILMPDGSIITGYYARYFKDHPETINQDIVSHCLRWRLPDGWPPA